MAQVSKILAPDGLQKQCDPENPARGALMTLRMDVLARRHCQSIKGASQPSPQVPPGGSSLFCQDEGGWRILSVNP